MYSNRPSIAIMNSGGIRNSIAIGNISFSDMLGMMPFSNTIDLITLTGKDLKSVLEFSAKRLVLTDGLSGKGGFLQVSGILFRHLVYIIIHEFLLKFWVFVYIAIDILIIFRYSNDH